MTETSTETIQRFIAQFESGCQGCSMDCDDAQAFAEDLSALLDERDEAAERIEELEAACEVVSSEFEGDLWVVCRRILKKTGFDFHSDDGVQSAVFEEHINEVLADLKSRAEAAIARAGGGRQ